jgi:hypothetical protein
LDDGNILTGKPDQFDGKNPWLSGVDFPQQTNPLKLMAVQISQVCSIPGCALLSDGSQRSGSNGSSAADLARRLLLEREKGSGSEFEPYISG